MKRSKTAVEAIRRDFQNSIKYYRARLGKYLPDALDARILDIPCGEGRFLFTLKALGYKNFYGIDLDEGRIDTCLSLGLPATKGDVFTFLKREKDSSIDFIISMDFLEHLEKEQVIDFLQLVNHKLVRGGRFILRMPCADGFFGGRHIFNDFTHKWGATSGVIRDLLVANGFENAIVLGEDPVVLKPWDVIRIPLFLITRLLTKYFLLALGLTPPVIWSNSMFAVTEKK